MPIIDANGTVVADDWIYRSSEKNALFNKAAVSLEDFLATVDNLKAGDLMGVLLRPGESLADVLPFLDRVHFFVIEFPKFRDGRGFTIARALREKHAFKGDIRAVGHVLPDQFTALVRCGFSSIATPGEHPPEQWKSSGTEDAESQPRQGQLLHRLIRRGLQ